MTNKYKHMDYIQSTISRMSANSFYLKGWNVTIISAILALSFKESDQRIYFVALALDIIFWFIDSYYLRQEKLFRELYKKVSLIDDDNMINFSMDTDEFQKSVPSIVSIMLQNAAITPLYLSIAIILLIVVHIV